ncbi:MAG TPA: MFS transporter [Pyrinomonadaceae bacterium]|nr:MFS transporter [Chloracidobacterium sp.]HRJ89416.1 MFS transporter [Pyrinomonadaceae bacterium]HRK51925.1 MFS transporter [Pyrinomonadaceae bacterium]
MPESEKISKFRFWRRYKGLPPTVFALSLVSFLNDTSSEIIYPLLPAFLFLTLGATPFAIGLIEGLAESVASILKLFSGYLSDRFGRRKLPVFLGYSLAAVVRPMLAFVTSWPQVLVVRMSDRIGKGIRGAPRDALLAADVPEDKRGLAFGFNRAADHLGAVVGPIVAFLLLTYLAVDPENPTAMEYQRVFLFASVPVALGLFVIVFFVHEERKPIENVDTNPIKFSLREFDPNFKRFLLIVALFTLSNSTDAFLLLRAEQAGIAPAMLPLLWMVLHFSKVFSSLIGGELSDKFGRKTLIVSGWVVYAAVYGGFAFVDSAWQAWVLFIIYGAYFGLTEGVEKAMVADLVKDEKRGTGYGFYNLAYGITVFPASLLFGFLWYRFGPETAFLISASISIVAAGFLLTVKGNNDE